jgi:hypothetical protein
MPFMPRKPPAHKRKIGSASSSPADRRFGRRRRDRKQSPSRLSDSRGAGTSGMGGERGVGGWVKLRRRKCSVRNAAFDVALSFCPLHPLRRNIGLVRGDESPCALVGCFLPRLRPLSGGLLFPGESLFIVRYRTKKDRRSILFELWLTRLRLQC